MDATFLKELRRRGVLGAVTAYGVVAAGGLQVVDIVSHAMEWPAWSMRAIVWVATLGLPVTAAISWFWDLTRKGFVRTEAPTPRASSPLPAPQVVSASAALQTIGPGGVIAGRYRVEKLLGSGGMGRVLAAEDLRLGRRVAIKVVTGAHEPSSIRRFEQEARTAGALEHPNILAVYDLGEHEGVPFLVTELLEGETLRARLDRGPIAGDEAHQLALQLARGLAAAHARGVVHRDLKPENLFLTRDGRLKILDFGLAKLTAAEGDTPQGTGLTSTGAIFGTPGYLSPEQARGGRATAASDVFGAGAVIHEMVTGARAFPGASLIEAGHAALTLDPPPLGGSLGDVVRAALEKDPRVRLQDGSALAEALESAQRGAPVHAVRPRRALRTPAWLALAALAVAATAASLVRVSAPRQERQRPVHAATAPAAWPPAPPAPPAPQPTNPLDGESWNPLELQGDPAAGALQFGQEMARSGMLTGVRALERVGRLERAERLLDRALVRNPDDLYLRIERCVLFRRAAKWGDARRDAREFLLHAPDAPWPAPVLHAFAEDASEASVIDAAGGDPRRLAEAFFYLGELRATAQPPDRAAAARFFQRAADQPVDSVQRGWAREELEASR